MSLFEPTIPFGEPELMRVSDFQRYLHEPGGRVRASSPIWRMASRR
ncbi:hypothetical protein LRS03_16120 [Rhizobacter sp. J219]|nr:hypothetical protein [Rhizobacter sp. J219]MCR5884295.1 hypothetical protein [Rhizobacter sp. J219]